MAFNSYFEDDIKESLFDAKVHIIKSGVDEGTALMQVLNQKQAWPEFRCYCYQATPPFYPFNLPYLITSLTVT